MNISKKIMVACLGLVFSSQLIAERIEKLTPPIIDESTIQHKVTCTRPMRQGKFNISVEKQDGKTFIHCYGHGGSGCTTSFGSIRRAIDLYEQQTKDPKVPIRVVGAGVIGLTAVNELILRGYEVTGITARDLYDIPSWKNAGYFALVSVQTDPVEQENLNNIGMCTYNEYKSIHEGTHPYITSECVRLLPVYCSEETESGVEDLEERGLIPPKESVTLDFGNGVLHPHFNKYMTYFMDTTRIMIQMREKVAQMGIPIEIKELKSLNELSESVVFNCSGLGAKQLNSDDKMIAVRGHLLNLNEQSGTEHLNYMIYTKVKGKNGSDGYVYMFPKCLQVLDSHYSEGQVVYGTLGGTFIPNTDLMTQNELDLLDQTEFQNLIDRNLNFFWGKSYAE